MGGGGSITEIIFLVECSRPLFSEHFILFFFYPESFKGYYKLDRYKCVPDNCKLLGGYVIVKGTLKKNYLFLGSSQNFWPRSWKVSRHILNDCYEYILKQKLSEAGGMGQQTLQD